MQTQHDYFHALGLIGEGAEVSEIVKKCIFQGKPFDEDAKKKLKSELSDCMWYIAQGCIALNTSIEELIDINTAKLSARYPDGFDKDKSNNRKKTDIMETFIKNLISKMRICIF